MLAWSAAAFLGPESRHAEDRRSLTVWANNRHGAFIQLPRQREQAALVARIAQMPSRS
jgi:hypothetical protein